MGISEILNTEPAERDVPREEHRKKQMFTENGRGGAWSDPERRLTQGLRTRCQAVPRPQNIHESDDLR